MGRINEDRSHDVYSLKWTEDSHTNANLNESLKYTVYPKFVTKYGIRQFHFFTYHKKVRKEVKGDDIILRF